MAPKKSKAQLSKAREILLAYEKSASNLKRNNQKSIRDIITENFTEENDKSSVIFPDGPNPDFLWSFDDIELIDIRGVDEHLLHNMEQILKKEGSSIHLECKQPTLKYVELLASATPSNSEIEEKVKEVVENMRELNDLYEKTMISINDELSSLINGQIEEFHSTQSIDLHSDEE